MNEWLKVSKSLEDQLTPVAPLFHGSLESLPEGFQYIPGPTSTSTTTQPTAVSDLMASVSPSRCAMLRVLQQLVIIGGWDEVTLLPSDPDSMTSLPDSIDALSRFSAASPIAIDGSRCLLADVDGPSLLTHLSHCVCCGNVDLYTPVMRGLLDSVIGDTASSVAPPPSHDRVYTPFLALLSFYQQRLQQVYGIEAEGIQPVLGFDFMAATVQLTLNNPTLTSSFSSWIHNPKPMGPGVSRGADLQLLWSSGAMSEDALLNSSFHCCLLHAIEWLVTSAAPSTALSFQRAGVSISQVRCPSHPCLCFLSLCFPYFCRQLCASWMSQCFWNVCNLSDVLMLAFILPSVCGVKWFVYACSALLLSADASVIREGIIAGEDAATLHRRCHRLAIHWQSLTADMKAFEASHDTAVDALLALTGNKMS